MESDRDAGGFQVTDPWRNPGRIIYIRGDDASVAPLPPGTRVGNHVEMAAQFEPFHLAMVELTADPQALRSAVNRLMDGWDPDEVRPLPEDGDKQ